MIFDDANSRITDVLSGKTVDYVTRNGKNLELVCTCGHVVVLAADVDHDIQLRKVDVRVKLPRIRVDGQMGKI